MPDLVLKFVLPELPQVSIVTTVTGDARQNATVAVQCDARVVWSADLTPIVYTVQLPYDQPLMDSGMILKKDATFTLTIPTSFQNGAMSAVLTIVTTHDPVGQNWALQVASWPLSS